MLNNERTCKNHSKMTKKAIIQNYSTLLTHYSTLKSNYFVIKNKSADLIQPNLVPNTKSNFYE